MNAGVYVPTGVPLREAQDVLILKALIDAGGNHVVACRLLDIHTSTLWRRLRGMEEWIGVEYPELAAAAQAVLRPAEAGASAVSPSAGDEDGESQGDH